MGSKNIRRIELKIRGFIFQIVISSVGPHIKSDTVFGFQKSPSKWGSLNLAGDGRRDPVGGAAQLPPVARLQELLGRLLQLPPALLQPWLKRQRQPLPQAVLSLEGLPAARGRSYRLGSDLDRGERGVP